MTDKLYEVVSRVFGIPVSQITDESGQEDIESWDSFNVYVLLDEIESTFGVKFGLDETIEIKKVGDLRKLLQNHEVG